MATRPSAVEQAMQLPVKPATQAKEIHDMATTPEDTPEITEPKTPRKRTTTVDASAANLVQSDAATGDDDASAPLGIVDQATATARKAASRGKDRAAGGIEELAGLIEDVAKAIEYRLGDQYGSYARKAATAVSGVSGNLKQKEVDELLDDARDFVRKQPGLALGAAAAVGFALTRIVKAGEDDRRGGTDSN